jgi:hypothetical protein
MNKDANDPPNGLENGVQLGNGDGTVPLVSLGALCYQGWRTKELNPHHVKVCLFTGRKCLFAQLDLEHLL